jgi:hypothetical protein
MKRQGEPSSISSCPWRKPIPTEARANAKADGIGPTRQTPDAGPLLRNRRTATDHQPPHSTAAHQPKVKA